MSSCSSGDPAQAKEWQRDYCTKLGSWQDARRAKATNAADADASAEGNGRSPEFDTTASAGRAVIEASNRLDQEGLELDGGHIHDDTANAVGGDTGAEERAVSYCDSSGFETLVDSAG
ncbi:hypothetical protein [Streptomyces sp. NPDC058989]|uniref:hypothetical protein n=1 Tax=Streptomyces sp. NPDC058989 TaxID=3346686 RepID=UPI00369DE62A